MPRELTMCLIFDAEQVAKMKEHRLQNLKHQAYRNNRDGADADSDAD